MEAYVQDTSGRLNSLVSHHTRISSLRPLDTLGRLADRQHDLVLDYVNHCAYSSTARVLSQPRHKRDVGVAQPTPIEHAAGQSTNGSNGSGNDSMDIDGASGSVGDVIDIASLKDREKERLITEAELASIEKRRGQPIPHHSELILVILNFILNGAIIRAVEALNTHFPTVLDDTAPSSVTNEWTSSTSTPTRPPPNPTRSPNHSTPVLVHSSHPSHVKLNLQIQSFIESFRNLAPSSPSTPSSSISSLTSSMHMSGHIPNPLLGHSSNGTSHGANGGGPSSGVTLTNALTAAQGLHAEAKKLPPDVRAIYLQEIKDVGALFAYTDPETSILKGFLDQNRRIALAEQVNMAILSMSLPRKKFSGLTSRFRGEKGTGVLDSHRGEDVCFVCAIRRVRYRS